MKNKCLSSPPFSHLHWYFHVWEFLLPILLDFCLNLVRVFHDIVTLIGVNFFWVNSVTRRSLCASKFDRIC